MIQTTTKHDASPQPRSRIKRLDNDQLSLFGLEAPALETARAPKAKPAKQKPTAAAKPPTKPTAAAKPPTKPTAAAKPPARPAKAAVTPASKKVKTSGSNSSKEIVTTLPGGVLWQMAGVHCVAYVNNANIACELLEIDRRHLAKQAMATYYDKKSRPYAWQVRFEKSKWNQAVKLLTSSAD